MEIVTKIAPIALALIMLGLGLGLKVEDFTRVLKNPKDFIVGLFCQLIILPVVAYLLIIILKTPLELALGVMIIAAAPGGVTSNVLTKFANGDVALSISLTAIISLISIISVPLIIFQSAALLGVTNISQEITMTGIALKMALVVTVPVILGMILKKFLSNFASAFEKKSKKISIILFVLVLAGAILAEKQNIVDYFIQAGTITLTLNIVMMVLAFYIAQLLGTGNAQKKCISIECGLQNGTLAIFIATTLFGGGIYLIPASTYSLIMFATSLIFVFFIKKVD